MMHAKSRIFSFGVRGSFVDHIHQVSMLEDVPGQTVYCGRIQMSGKTSDGLLGGGTCACYDYVCCFLKNEIKFETLILYVCY